MCDGNMQRPSHSVFKIVFGKAVFCLLFYLDSIFVTELNAYIVPELVAMCVACLSIC